MKIDRDMKVVLWVIAALLFLNLLSSFFSSQTALALRGNEDMGRYQISSWAAYGGATIAHIGYYVVDTVTGKVVAKGSEIHTRDE